jgi:hypothetical protein
MSLVARHVRRHHRIMVIRATGAPRKRSSAESRAFAGSGRPLPSPNVGLSVAVPVPTLGIGWDGKTGRYGTFPWASTAQIASSSATASGGRSRAAPAMFSRK